MLDWVRSQLIALGYHSITSSNKVWHQEDRCVITCVVDDITTCADSSDGHVAKCWKANTDVITDNYVTCPTLYRVHQLPSSWFGIYAHAPRKLSWTPDRRFCFSANRLDAKRMLLFLEYQRRLPWQADRDNLDYVNFNCWAWDGDNTGQLGFQNNWDQQWQRLDDHQRDTYADIVKQNPLPMPYRNHGHDLETVMHSAWINLVIETYSGDSVVALSEKIFRALTTPAPWMVYAGRYTVVYLESLGFDCLSDVMDHSYDAMIETRTVDYGDKLVDWFWKANENYARLTARNFAGLLARCQQAAHHNQKLLSAMRSNWPRDFSQWWAHRADMF